MYLVVVCGAAYLPRGAAADNAPGGTPFRLSPPGAANARGEILGDYFIIILLLIEFRGGDSSSEKSASEGNA
jgi:hypothetical protein